MRYMIQEKCSTQYMSMYRKVTRVLPHDHDPSLPPSLKTGPRERWYCHGQHHSKRLAGGALLLLLLLLLVHIMILLLPLFIAISFETTCRCCTTTTTTASSHNGITTTIIHSDIFRNDLQVSHPRTLHGACFVVIFVFGY